MSNEANDVIVGNVVDGFYGTFRDNATAFEWATDRMPTFYVGRLHAPAAYQPRTEQPSSSDAPKPAEELTDDEFNRMLAGPLSHPMPMFVITRLAMALRCVVEEIGGEAAEALRAHCLAREEADRRDEEC